MLIKQLDITNSAIAKKILKLQTASYLVEAQIIDFYEIPPLKDTVQSLQECGETFLGYYLNGEICGAISYKVEKEIVDIHRLMVHPEHFKKGIAETLLKTMENNQNSIDTIIVSTGSKNVPAKKFYQKHGFQVTGEKIVLANLSLTSFMKRIKKS
ncbi:GNAT family N-acetyltransferase [Sutcliffiella halmapala]|uniref:GNAT family N-acetyltransferase n=1 Tax=Sutcliffiella halmapala TaxID=79882 RepID=UPI002E26C81E|nr:GNAT family N-acetyltransferase [Sutcliffiella halmapala]